MGTRVTTIMGNEGEAGMHIKMREMNCRHAVQTAMSCMFLFLAVMGVCMVCFGIAELPKCRYGGDDCYFFVRICGQQFFESSTSATSTTTNKCAWVPRLSRVEGSSDEG